LHQGRGTPLPLPICLQSTFDVGQKRGSGGTRHFTRYCRELVRQVTLP
jgi:hypothetical protein